MNKKKKTLIIISIIVCIILFSIVIFSLAGVKQNDWYYKLNNNYEIWHINTKEIVLGKRDDSILTDTIGDSITEFKYNEAFVIIKCFNNDNKEVYYIVNMTDDTTYGPYNKEEYLSKEKELNINISNWIKTKPAPKGAKYD